MYIHREGRKLIFCFGIIITVIYMAMIFVVDHWNLFHYLFMSFLLVGFVLLVLFFRIPRRIFTVDDMQLISPADGTVVTIEETVEKEYIKDKCVQLSIFMNGNDVHVNRYPCNGLIEYVKYHKGNYFVASYPKSSVLNERTTVGMRLDSGEKIVIRQVAGVMARRIVCYAREGERVLQNQEMGFIKFGSRVDLFLPVDFDINVELQDVVRNAVSPVASVCKRTESGC